MLTKLLQCLIVEAHDVDAGGCWPGAPSLEVVDRAAGCVFACPSPRVINLRVWVLSIVVGPSVFKMLFRDFGVYG